jgi:hypothetical protein
MFFVRELLTLYYNYNRTITHRSVELLDSWHTSLTTILDEVAPISSYSANRKACKWLAEDVRGLMQQRDSLARKIAIQPTEDLINKCSLLKCKVKSRMRRAAKQYGSNLLAQNDQCCMEISARSNLHSYRPFQHFSRPANTK